MKLFITGSESFVGKELITKCEVNGIEYIGIDIANVTRPNCHQVDIRSEAILDLIPQGIDAIVHLGALSRDRDCINNAYNCFDTNVMGTLNLMDAAQKRNSKQFIFASTEWVYGSFSKNEIKDEDSFIDITSLKSEYALSKIVSEANLKQKYLRGFCSTAVLRFGIIYGPRKDNWSAVESIFSSVKNNRQITIGSLKTARCFIHVTDIAGGIIKSIGLSGFNILNLQGDRAVTIENIIETGKQIVNTNPKIVESDRENPNIKNISNVLAKQLLHWKPEIGLEDGMRTLLSVI